MPHAVQSASVRLQVYATNQSIDLTLEGGTACRNIMKHALSVSHLTAAETSWWYFVLSKLAVSSTGIHVGDRNIDSPYLAYKSLVAANSAHSSMMVSAAHH